MGLPANAIIQVAYGGLIMGQRWQNVMHMRVAAEAPVLVTPQSEILGLLNILNDNTVGGFKQLFRSCLSETAEFNYVSVQAIWPIRYVRQTAFISDAGLGDPTNVPNVQASITTRTALSGRDQVGGVRIVASPANASGGVWQPQYLTTLQNFASSFPQAIGNPALGSNYNWVIAHRKEDDSYTSDDIENAFPQLTTRVMRRRTVGVGE